MKLWKRRLRVLTFHHICGLKYLLAISTAIFGNLIFLHFDPDVAFTRFKTRQRLSSNFKLPGRPRLASVNLNKRQTFQRNFKDTRRGDHLRVTFAIPFKEHYPDLGLRPQQFPSFHGSIIHTSKNSTTPSTDFRSRRPSSYYFTSSRSVLLLTIETQE